MVVITKPSSTNLRRLLLTAVVAVTALQFTLQFIGSLQTLPPTSVHVGLPEPLNRRQRPGPRHTPRVDWPNRSEIPSEEKVLAEAAEAKGLAEAAEAAEAKVTKEKVKAKKAADKKAKALADEKEKTAKALADEKDSRHTLRFDWSNLPPLSPLAQQISASQSPDCHDSKLKFQSHTMIASGLGSTLHSWSQSLCHAIDNNMVLITPKQGPWLWNDARYCTDRKASPLHCYIGKHESASYCHFNITSFQASTSNLYNLGTCPSIYGSETSPYTKTEFRAAAMEWLFQSVNPVVLEEAKRQIEETFGPDGIPKSEDLITVHIRWGDKGREMKLVAVKEYIKAVKDLIHEDASDFIGNETQKAKPVNIYLSSTDSEARKQFRSAAPPHWKVYTSGNMNPPRKKSVLSSAMSSKGRDGLESMAALLIALEANKFVLTLASNWSRLINELRKNVVNPRCGNCTSMTDLRQGEW
jgi:hypothetical protein